MWDGNEELCQTRWMFVSYTIYDLFIWYVEEKKISIWYRILSHWSNKIKLTNYLSSNQIIHTVYVCDGFTLKNIFSTYYESYGCEILKHSNCNNTILRVLLTMLFFKSYLIKYNIKNYAVNGELQLIIYYLYQHHINMKTADG